MEVGPTLLSRNIELETELRLTKEQLTQTRDGMLYLVNALHQQNSYSLKSADAQSLREARAEIDRLRNCLIYSYQYNRGHAPVGDALNGDLFTFDRNGFPATTPPSSYTVDRGTEKSILDDDSLMSRLNARKSKENAATRHPPQHYGTLVNLNVNYVDAGIQTEEIHDEYIKPKRSLGNDDWVVDQTPRSPTEYQPATLTQRFGGWEHSILAGSATFIEDMSEIERAEYFQNLHYDKGRHTAEDWQSYYESAVRPKHLAYEEEKAKARVENEALKQVSKLGCVSPDEYIAQHMDGEASGTAMAGMADVGDEEIGTEKAEDQQHLETSRTIGVDLIRFDIDTEHTNIVVSQNQATVDSHETPVDQLPEEVKNKSEIDAKFESACEGMKQISLKKEAEIKPNIELGRLAAQIALHASQNLIQVQPSNVPHTPDSSPVKATKGNDPYTPRQSFIVRLPQISDETSFLCYHSQWKEDLRTVLISNIPVNVRLLRHVLAKVRGGKILSSTFCNTAGMNTTPPITTNSVLIEFFEAEAAMNYVDFCKEHRIFFRDNSTKTEVQARVELLTTPTRPVHPQIQQLVGQGRLTRMLYILDPKHSLTPDQAEDQLRKYGATWPLKTTMDDDGVLVAEFKGVREAEKAWNVVNGWFTRDMQKGCLPDPCERGLDELLPHGSESLQHKQ